MNSHHPFGTSFTYEVIRKTHKKHVTISIDDEGTIKISAPPHVPLKELEALLLRKTSWINKHLSKISQRPVHPINRFATSEFIPYLGEQYPLTMSSISGKSYKLHFNNNALHIGLPGMTINQHSSPGTQFTEGQAMKITSLVKRWYIQQGHGFAQEILPKYTDTITRLPQKIVFKEQKRRWGSCTRQGNIYLNWRLMMAPASIVEYVLIHELAHLVHFNHAKAFWLLVETLDPDYRQKINWLKEKRQWLSSWQ